MEQKEESLEVSKLSTLFTNIEQFVIKKKTP